MEKDLMQQVKKILKCIDDKFGEDTVVLDLRKLSTICDYFIITSGQSIRQTKAIADEIQDKLEEEGIYILRKEGHGAGRWILLDYGDIVIHVFYQEDRDFYNLEKIWKDAYIIDVDKVMNNNI